MLTIVIDRSRSRHEDSDKASISIAVGNGSPSTATRDLGDLHDGRYPGNLRIRPVTVSDPNVGIAFNYLILNSGHSNWDTVNGLITKAGNELASAGAKAATSAIGSAIGASIGTGLVPVVGTALGAIAGWLVGEVTGLLVADCDGPVAAEQAAFKGIDLWNRTQASGKKFDHTTFHPGIDSSYGCGSNSKYWVTWRVQRLG